MQFTILMNMIYRILFLLGIFLIINVNSFGQFYKQSQADSLTSILSQQEGRERVRTLLHLADCYYYIQLDTAISYANRAKKEAKKNNFEWGKYKSQFLSAKIQYENLHVDEVAPLVLSSHNWFKNNNFKDDQIESAIFYSHLMNINKGGPFVKKIDNNNLKEAEKSRNYSLLGKAWLNIETHKPNLLDNSKKMHLGSIDSSLTYFNLSGDSINLLKADLKVYILKAGRPEIFKKTKSWMQYGLSINNNVINELTSNFMALNHTLTRQNDSAQYYLDKSTKFITYRGSKRSKIMIHKINGYSHYRQENFVEALENYQKSYDYSVELGNRKEAINLLRQIAAIHGRQGSYNQAMKCLVVLINEAEELGNQYLFNSGRRALGDLYSRTGEYDKAKEIYFQTLAWADTALTGPVKSNLCRTTHTQLGEIYKIQKEYDKALIYFIGDTTSENVSANRRIVANFGLLQTYLEMGNIEKMITEYEAIFLNFPKKTIERQTNFLFFKGEVLIAQKKYQQGVKVLEEYLRNTKKIKVHENHLNSYQHLYKAYKELGKYKQALSFLEISQELKDSLKSGQTIQNAQKIQANYELSLKESEIEKLEQQKEISDLKLVKQENELSLRKLYITLLGFIFLILGGIGYLLFRRLQFRKEEEKREIKKQLEIESLKSEQKIEVAEVKNKLYANISHEFKTPLTLIRVPLQNFKTNASLEERTVYDSVLKNTDYLLEMLDELLSVSSMQSNKFELHFSNFNLTEFLSQIKLNFDPLFAEKNIQFDWVIKLDQNYFYGDESRLNIVINNLLKNAYSNTSKGGWVKCIVQSEQGFKITISNKGKQIDPDDLPHIFERFYRASENNYSGTGIGLSWSKQIVDLHGGTIRVDNSKNDQVSFSVQIPVIRNTEKTAANLNIKNKTQLIENNHFIIDVNHSQRYLPHILVVEDNLEMQELLDNILKSEFHLDFAENGKVGEEMAIELQPDLIISDVMMPVKDGFELLKAIKENFNSSHIPIILLTALTDSISRISGLNQDADDYIGKPFDPIELKSRINNLLRQRLNLHKLFSENPLLYSKEVKCTPIDSDFIDRARNILKDHFSNGDFSVRDFCMELALNRTSVNTKIKALTNQSTAEYIKNFRLEKAAKMLIESNSTIIEICTDTGFNNPQVFNKAFKKKFNSTPSKYRSNFYKQ